MSLWMKTNCLIYVPFNSLFFPQFSLGCAVLLNQPANNEAQGSWRNSEAVPSAFKGNSSASSHRLAAPYITPSVPECKPRRLVSILRPECKGRVTVWPICLSPLLPSLLKTGSVSFSKTPTTPAHENGSQRLNRWQTIWENSFWVQVWLCSVVGKQGLLCMCVISPKGACIGRSWARVRLSVGRFHSCLGAVCDFPAAFNTCSSHRRKGPRACRITERWEALSYD